MIFYIKVRKIFTQREKKKKKNIHVHMLKWSNRSKQSG